MPNLRAAVIFFGHACDAESYLSDENPPASKHTVSCHGLPCSTASFSLWQCHNVLIIKPRIQVGDQHNVGTKPEHNFKKKATLVVERFLHEPIRSYYKFLSLSISTLSFVKHRTTFRPGFPWSSSGLFDLTKTRAILVGTSSLTKKCAGADGNELVIS